MFRLKRQFFHVNKLFIVYIYISINKALILILIDKLQ